MTTTKSTPYCPTPVCSTANIGKVAIPDSILLKAGRLSTEEFETMKTHSTLGALTLEAVRGRYPRNAFITGRAPNRRRKYAKSLHFGGAFKR